jgi:hypothetical protein
LDSSISFSIVVIYLIITYYFSLVVINAKPVNIKIIPIN